MSRCRKLRCLASCCVLLNALPALAQTGEATDTAAQAPLADPRSDDQEPRPYRAPREPDRRLELFELGLLLGVAARPADSDAIHYSVGPSYGVQGRVEVLPWLGVRALVTNSIHSVSVDSAALLERTSADQPSLQVLEIGARVEPTLTLAPHLRGWLGVGMSWNRIWADAPSFEGRRVQGVNRTGVAVEYSALAST